MQSKNQTLAVIGMQWGDEGKGKIIDVLSKNADVVARFNGGNNAGHTLKVGETKIVLHIVPSGILSDKTTNIIGNGVVVDPKNIIKKEFKDLTQAGFTVTPDKLSISSNAHVILPNHIDEDKKKGEKLGTTGRGIGPTYASKIARTGLRMSEFVDEHYFKEHFQDKDFYQEYADYANTLRPFVTDTVHKINESIIQNKKILFEGAQATLLDIDHGTYPYVTSSNTTAGGIATGLGIAPKHIHKTLGILKAYTTRVGTGPFPTELEGEIAEHLQDKGHEFGSTTGRRRRVGWLDIVAAKYTVMLNGLDSVAIMKLDVLDECETINICTGYELNENKLDHFTNDINVLEKVKPIYQSFPGWKTNTSECKDYDALPDNTKTYLQAIQDMLKIPISIVSIGPERTQTIVSRQDMLF